MIDIVPGEPLIVFDDVHAGFEEAEVLRGLSFEVWPGETKVVLGESGAGKTVLLKLAAGLLRPDLGRILVMGHNVGEMSEHDLLDFRRQIGFVFQEGALFDSLTVGDNVAFLLKEAGVPEEESAARVLEALRFVEMEGVMEKFPPELSGGMRRRVSIARALISQPPIVFYDSPTAGLDPVTSQTIITLILRLRDLHHVSSMLATHRLQDALGLAHFRFDSDSGRVVPVGGNGVRPQAPPTNFLVLRDGKSYFQGGPEELMSSADSYLKQFFV